MYIISVSFLPQKSGFLPQPHHGELSDLQASRLLQSSMSCFKTDPSIGVNGQVPVFV